MAGDSNHNIELIEGVFTPSEALQLLENLIDVKINFHTLHRLAVAERDEQEECTEDNSRIEMLNSFQRKNKSFLKEVKMAGKKVRIEATVHITEVE
ncbi:MAG: hypothetical protein WBA16_01730 [Nonlabens sp.]